MDISDQKTEGHKETYDQFPRNDRKTEVTRGEDKTKNKRICVVKAHVLQTCNMVWVLPLPVCPYAMIAPLKPQ